MLPATGLNSKLKITLLVLLAIFCGAYAGTFATLLTHWLAFDGNQSHGLVVILITAFLLAKQLNQIDASIIRPNGWGLLLLLALSLVWYLAAIANIDIAEQILLPPILAGILFTLLGWPCTRKLLPIIALLIFAIPIWDYLVPGLVEMASVVVGKLVEASKIPALVEGNSFYLPEGKVDIVGGCSGVKYLTIALLISYYILITSYSSLSQKATLLAMAVVLSIVMNWVRIFIIIQVAYLSKMQSALVSDHERFGWLLFAIVLVPLILVGRRLPTQSKHNAQQESPLEPAQVGSQPALYLLVLTGIAMATGPAALQMLSHQPPGTLATNPFAGMQGIEVRADPGAGMLTINSANRISRYRVDNPSATLYVEIAEHWQSSPEDKLVPYISSLYDRSIWSKKASESVVLEDGETVSALQLEKKPFGYAQILVYWFTVGEYHAATYSTAKLLQIPAITFGDNRFQLIAISSGCRLPDCSESRKNVIALANKLNDSDLLSNQR